MFENSVITQLTVKDFDINGNQVSISNPKFKNKDGCIMIYAPWCPHCRDAEELINYIDKIFKQHPDLGMNIGVVNGSDNINQKLVQALGLQGFPSYYHVVCQSGKISKFTDAGYELLEEFKKSM